MGRAKELMMEMADAQWDSVDITFHCPICEDEVCGTVDLPTVYENAGEQYLPVSVLCFGCSNTFEGWVTTDWDRCEIVLDDNPDLEIEVSPSRANFHDDYDDYDDYEHSYYEWLEQQELISRPVFQSFCKTIDDVKSLTSHDIPDQQSQMLARMLLAQSITALEVFLADTLILSVSSDQDAQSRLLKSKELGIGQIQFTLADVIGIPDVSKDKLLENLRAVSFHNLKKVTKLFKVGLGIDILPKDADLERINNAIKLRHDCVHRNGMDMNTREIHQIDRELLRDLVGAISRMVSFIDRKLVEFEDRAKDKPGVTPRTEL